MEDAQDKWSKMIYIHAMICGGEAQGDHWYK